MPRSSSGLISPCPYITNVTLLDGHCSQIVKLAGWFLLLLIGVVSSAVAASISVAWDPNPEPDIVGYQLHYGVASGIYTQTIDVGNSTSATISDLVPGITYYLVVTAWNSNSLESPASNEVTFELEAPAPPGAISSISRWYNGMIQLTVKLFAPQQTTQAFTSPSAIHVYYSNDLTTWTWLQDISPGSGTVSIFDPGAALARQRFYRLSYEVADDK
jgi:hypothetical protein